MNAINDIANNIADKSGAIIAIEITGVDYYYGFMSKTSAVSFGGYLVSAALARYMFSAYGGIQIF